MKKFFLIFVFVLLLFIINPLSLSYADSSIQSPINNGINYLGTQLNGPTGQIKGGSTSDASPWAAIAFSANGIDPSTVKTSTNAPSLIDYLQTNHPTNSSAATEWEKWILAITASGQNPYNFGGVNYVSTLESTTYYHNNQIGDTTSVTDDWFGVMALIASGADKTNTELTDSLSFILAHQNSDGGFGYSTTAGSDSNDTAAAIQALVDAQNYGATDASLSAAISNAKIYLFSTQDKSGGFLYDTNPWTTAPDSDSTTWAIMALNALGMKNTTQWNSAVTWLISQQSKTDSGFTACNNWDANGNCTSYTSNSTTTSHALIGLAGKEWILKIFSASNTTPAPTVSITPTNTPLVTPTVIPTQPNGVTPTPTPAITNTTPTYTPTLTPQSEAGQSFTEIVTPIPTTPSVVPTAVTISTSPAPTTTQKVLGTQTTSYGQIALVFTFLGISTISLGAYGFRKWKGV